VVAPGHSDIDVGLIDVSTGGSLALPAGVNTTAAIESHPTISTDGKRLAFERVNLAAGTDRLIVADLTTGQTMDLFNAFETATLHPTSPSISPDGDCVTTGSKGTGLHGRGLEAFPNSVSSSSNDDTFSGSVVVDPTQTEPNDTGPFAFRRNIPLGTGGTADRSSSRTPRASRRRCR
jgi:WD40-like Beta Propeller Repeat